jgi:hypothetical protein
MIDKHDAFIGGLCAGVLGAAILFAAVLDTLDIAPRHAISVCEADLPRSQKCVLIAIHKEREQ